jgi:hydroxyacid-oxoacid transhydrogenase
MSGDRRAGVVGGDTRIAVSASNLVYGPGATEELGDHAAELGLRRVLLLTDPRLVALAPVDVATRSLRAAGIDVAVYAEVEVEPTDASFLAAADAARDGGSRGFDGFVAVGGGSTMDTAKAANLYATWPADLLTYVNTPVGDGAPPPGPLRPLICVPTTAGTGSETTGVAIFDYRALHAKTGIAHRRLRPTLGIVDPLNTLTQPPMVTACSGFDVLSHALESFTALPSAHRPAPSRPTMRPAYQGANAFSDIWAQEAIAMVARSLVRAVEAPDDLEARAEMSLAATYAGIGFGNAGVHLPHGMSYAVSGLVRDYRAPGYPIERALVPHGMSVILNAPAVFRWTASADPARHLRAAALLGADTREAGDPDEGEPLAGELLAGELVALMRRTGMPDGLAGVGYGEADVPSLAEGTLPQHRVITLSPRPVEREDLEALFRSAMHYW